MKRRRKEKTWDTKEGKGSNEEKVPLDYVPSTPMNATRTRREDTVFNREVLYTGRVEMDFGFKNEKNTNGLIVREM